MKCFEIQFKVLGSVAFRIIGEFVLLKTVASKL